MKVKMKTYTVVVKTSTAAPAPLAVIAATSMDAYDVAAALYGDDCFAITVIAARVPA